MLKIIASLVSFLARFDSIEDRTLPVAIFLIPKSLFELRDTDTWQNAVSSRQEEVTLPTFRSVSNRPFDAYTSYKAIGGIT